MSSILGDAAAQPGTYGFTGDPSHSSGGGRGGATPPYYGYLVFAGGY